MNPYRKRADEFAAQIETLKAEAEEILSRDDDAVSEEDEATARAKVDEAKALKAKYDEATARADELDELQDVVVRGDTTIEGEHTRLESVNVNTRTDPFDGIDKWRAAPGGNVYFGADSSEDVRSRLETVIEKHLPDEAELPDDVKEGLTKSANRRSNRLYNADLVRAHMLETSTPEYLRAFDTFVRTGGQVTAPVLFERAAWSLTAANGGVAVPQFLDPTIRLTNAGIIDEVRGAAGVVQITVDQWDGVTSAGATAEWLAEGTQAADASPTFVGPTITAHKEAAWIFASIEVLMDSALSNDVGMLLNDAFERLEGTSHATGTGSGQPFGLVTRLSGTGPTLAGSSGAAGAADFVAADVYALDNGLDQRWKQNAKFVANKAIYNEVRKMGTANTYHAFWVDFGGGVPSSLIGYPTLQNSAFDSTIVSGSNDDILLLGDLANGYLLVDRIGTTVQYVPTVFSGSNRPTGQAGWFAYRRHGADVLTSNAFRLLRV
jgi:HK97 family phage major capsid protein